MRDTEQLDDFWKVVYHPDIQSFWYVTSHEGANIVFRVILHDGQIAVSVNEVTNAFLENHALALVTRRSCEVHGRADKVLGTSVVCE